MQLLLLRGDLEHNCLLLENTGEHKFLDILCNDAWHSLVKGTWVHNWHLPSSNFGTTVIKNAANLTGALLYISERVSLSFVCLLWEQIPNSRNDVYVIFLIYWELDGYLICKLAMGNLEYPGRLLGLRLAWIPQGLGNRVVNLGKLQTPRASRWISNKDVMKAALGLGGLGCPEKQRMYRDLNEGRKIDPWRRVQGQKRSTLLLAHISLVLRNIAQVPQMIRLLFKGAQGT